MERYKSVGIVAEYNPFHNGHKYHLDKSLETSSAKVSVAVMSGNFTQRGEAAIFDKWTRAEMAVRNGVDLVVELPVIFACNNAGYFAEGAIDILENLGVDVISFGSESGNIEKLEEISREINNNKDYIQIRIKEAVKEGLTYPRARQAALEEIIGDRASEMLIGSNNILALEYLNAIRRAVPMTVARKGPGYSQWGSDGQMASAMYIRQCFSEGKDISQWITEISGEMIKNEKLFNNDFLFTLIAEKIFSTPGDELDKILSGGEGLGNKLKKSIRMCSTIGELADMLKSKRYTYTRICRFLTQILLGITKEDMVGAKKYVRVLALNKNGSTYLKEVKKSGICSLPIITNINKDLEKYPEIMQTIERDILASDLYNLLCQRDLYGFSDFVKMPYVL